MKRVINLGTIACDNDEKTKRYTATVEVELSDDNVFSMSGEIVDARHIVCRAGQCIAEIAAFFPDNELVQRLFYFWENYHLNDMHAGTPEQEKALRAAGLKNFASEYEICCSYLNSINLLEDNGYKFGSGWLKQEIPEDDLNEIREIIGGAENE